MESFQNGGGNVVLRRYSTTTEPRTPSTPSSPNGFGGSGGGGGGGGGGVVLTPSSLPAYDENDDVFFDEKLKQNNNELPHFSPPPHTPGTAHAPEITWAHRKLRVRHCLLIAALIILIVVIAVGVAVAIILTSQRDSDEPSPLTSPSTTPSPPSVITYSGNVQLRSPWEGSREQLQDNLSTDFVSIVSESALENYYRSTTLHDSKGTEVSFSVDFSPDVTYLVERKSPDRVREFLQTELRTLAAKKKDSTILDIIPETVNLVDYIPYTSTVTSMLSTTSFSTSTSPEPSSSTSPSTTTSTTSSTPSTTPTTTSTSTTTSTTEPTSTSTPSTTTTTESTTTSTSTTESTSTSTTTSTTESTTTTTESTPSTSTTTTTTTTESTSTSSTTESTTTPSTTTTGTTPTTLPLPADCLELGFEPCRGLGYAHYSLPNLFGSLTEAHAVEDFYFLANESINNACIDDLTFFCGFAFPPCMAGSVQTLPCLDLCEKTVSRCVTHFPFPMDCEGYPTEQPCLKSPFPPVTTPTTTAEPAYCSPQTFERCRNLGFEATRFPTWFAENVTENAKQFEKWAMPAVLSRCHPHVEYFMCAAFFPKCDENLNNITRPCRSFCKDVEKSCYGNGDILNLACQMFDTDPALCLPSPSSPTTPLTTTLPTVTTTTPMQHQCVPISIATCSHFGHVNGSLPSTWGAHDQDTTLLYYYEYLQPVVSTGCAASALFYTCEMLFPSCDHGVYLYPCRSVCQEYNTKCANVRGFLQQNCSFFDEYRDNNSCLLPPAKPSCAADEFTCEGAPICVPKSAKCDRNNDCGDWSDERDCECNADFEYKCDMGLCIRSYKRCDGETDCPDKSDEIGCPANCTNGQFRCDDGTCLMAEWVCDGQYDCPRIDDDDWFDEDEANCGSEFCKHIVEFSCNNGECIPASQRCDGTPHCKDHTDEKSCIILGPPAFLNVAGDVLPICTDTFTMELAHLACKRLGFSGAATWRHEEYYFYNFYHANESGLHQTILGRGDVVQACGGNGTVVSLECLPSECGAAPNLVNEVIDGRAAERGQIPWMASIQEFGKHFCGGSLIHPSFVLTAAHCVEKYTLNSQYLEVVLGAVDLTAPDPGKRTFFVKRIINHPNYVTFQGNDIALVELAQPAVYSDVIKPLCLRPPDDVFSRASPCYTAGWGKMDPDANVMAKKLQVVKMTLWDTGKCNSSFAWAGQLQSTEICAGYYAGIKSACRGDSGGALFCLDYDYTWRAVGVASYVHKGCNRPEKPVVFTDAVRYNPWIANNTVCQFKCRNGRCLYDKSMVCNKYDDCGDNSDEIDTCDISANCTFEDPYLCGYRSHWLTVTEALTANRYPLFDHTIGRYPGVYQLGAFRGKNLHTPRIDLTSPHCFRFRYHMRGRVKQGMAVSVHKLSQAGNWSTVWHQQQLEGPDRWLLGQFDLPAGHFDIVFSAYDNGVASVDDMLLLPGNCSVQGCLPGEFACNTSRVWNCLPEEVRCNTVIDCDTAEDETNCPAASYKCDFENGLLCGLEQDSHDSTSGEWRLVNASRAGFPDVTKGDGTGHMLQIVTERLLTTDYVYMGHDLHLGGQEHCLAFSYRSTSTARLEVNLYRSDQTSHTLWMVENRQTSDWSRTQVAIPADTESYLYYTVIGRELNRTVFHPMIALDDITINKGPCPAFTCPSGQSKCPSEAYCLDNSRFCDRVKDCKDFADEITCNCTAEEFKCPTGPCVPLDRTCDTVKDCPDASDEGTVCDSLRSTSCDFEHRFMCGYTHNGSLHEDAPYVWSREKNRRPGEAINVATGPIYDHTYQNKSGHWAFANGENGHPFDYVALESSPFSSPGSEVLVFYYFAYSYFSEFWVTGSLGLQVKNHDNHSQQLAWFRVVDGNDTWRSACVELPAANSVSVAFVAMRGQAQKADLAVDDVKVLQMTCDQFYVESRLRTGASTHNPHPTTTPPPGCPSGQWPCRNNMCIDDAGRCDGIKDCIDNSDEQDCGGQGG